jgi:hypothetical protein
VFLVVGGSFFATQKVWPWFTDRDAEQRTRDHEMALKAQETDLRGAIAAERIATRLERGLSVFVEHSENSQE